MRSRGNTFAILGPPGSGKTHALRWIMKHRRGFVIEQDLVFLQLGALAFRSDKTPDNAISMQNMSIILSIMVESVPDYLDVFVTYLPAQISYWKYSVALSPFAVDAERIADSWRSRGIFSDNDSDTDHFEHIYKMVSICRTYLSENVVFPWHFVSEGKIDKGQEVVSPDDVRAYNDTLLRNGGVSGESISSGNNPPE